MDAETDWKKTAWLFLKAYLCLRRVFYSLPATVYRDSRVVEATGKAAAFIALVPKDHTVELGRVSRKEKWPGARV